VRGMSDPRAGFNGGHFEKRIEQLTTRPKEVA